MKRIFAALSAILLIAMLFPTSVSASNTSGKGAGSGNDIVHAGSSLYVVKPDGSLWGWGYALAVKLGKGDYQDSAPIKIMDGVASVATPIIYNNQYGELAVKTNGDLVDIFTGKVLANNVIAAAADGSNLLIVKKDSSLYYSKVNTASPSFTKVMDNVSGICADSGNYFALKTDGTLWAWGVNVYLGNGQYATSVKNPVQVMSNVKSFCVSIESCYAVKTDGTLWAWGVNRVVRQNYVDGVPEDEWSVSFLGAGSSNQYILTPVKIMEDVQAVETSGYQSFAVKTDGTLWGWGQVVNDGIGDGTRSSRAKPVKIMDDVTAFSGGDGQKIAIKKDGTVWAWGWNFGGKFHELGAETTPYVSDRLFTGTTEELIQTPRQVQGITFK